MFTHIPHRIVVAPSGFKESLSAIEVADSIAAGLRRVLPGVRVDSFPVPDGGEGTVDILAQRPGSQRRTTRVTGPVGRKVLANWVMLERTAVIEMASAAGLALVPRDLRNPAETSTAGVGELLREALAEGADRIIVGCGDSGTLDGGAGALYALGARFYDADGTEISSPTGADLHRIARIETAGLDSRLADTKIELACNVYNLLTGPTGVVRVFGSQKGATSEQIEDLSIALEHWAGLLEQHFDSDYDLRLGEGSGASGGLGAGLAAIGAQPRNRFDVLLSRPLHSQHPTDRYIIPGVNDIRDELDELIAQADLVITAEGAIDFQTPHGKVPAEIARRAQRTGVPVLAIAGSLGDGAPDVHEVGIGAIASIMTVPMPLEDAVKDARRLLAGAAERSMRMLILGSAMAGQIRGRMGLRN